MKRSTKIILTIVAVLLIVGVFFAYMIYQATMGSERISGKQDHVPSPVSQVPPVTTDYADWTNWRGANFEGKSATTGINTDWSKGLEKIWHINYLCQDKATAAWSPLLSRVTG